MGGLIDLKLQPLGRNSISSTHSTSSDITPPCSPVLSSQKPQLRPRPILYLLFFPNTPKEWRFVMEQVKKLYLKGDYKQCAAWCKQILDNIKDPYRVHPLNSLYISFYCATCLEITASSLHNNAPQKLSLLQDALAYYQKAESYIPFAEIPTAPYFQAGSRVSSASSSRSSVDSVFSSALSSASTADTLSPLGSSSCSSYEEDESTPSRKRTASVSSAMSTRSDITSDEPLKPAPVRVKKKVSFSAQLPTLISTETLTSSPTNETPPPPAPPPPPYALPHPPILRPNPTTPQPTLFPSPSPLHLASLQTYTLTLTSLTSQLLYHITHIQALIASILRIRKSRRSNGPCSFAPSLDLTNPDPEARKKKELRERIERLRTQGWPRRRLDTDRYERLREKVEMELCGWIV